MLKIGQNAQIISPFLPKVRMSYPPPPANDSVSYVLPCLNAGVEVPLMVLLLSQAQKGWAPALKPLPLPLPLLETLEQNGSKQLQLQLLVAKPNKSGIETVDVRRALNDFVHLSDFILDSSENPSQLYY